MAIRSFLVIVSAMHPSAELEEKLQCVQVLTESEWILIWYIRACMCVRSEAGKTLLKIKTTVTRISLCSGPIKLCSTHSALLMLQRKHTAFLSHLFFCVLLGSCSNVKPASETAKKTF